MKNIKFLIAGWAVGFVLILFVLFSLVLSIPAGHVGVISNLGAVSSETLQEGGPYFVMPWKSVVRINTQTQRNDEQATVPTKGGLSVKINAVLQYHLDKSKVNDIYQKYGTQYEEKIIEPIFRNAVRDSTAEFSPEALYTQDRLEVEKIALQKTVKELEGKGFVVENVMLQDPILPDVVKSRIEAKLGAEQDVSRMEYVLKQKKLEADAKVVEAEGIAKAQAIVKKDLDHQYLVYLWIEALKESAKHNNAVIYIPTGMDGMPLFKNIENGPKK